MMRHVGIAVSRAALGFLLLACGGVGSAGSHPPQEAMGSWRPIHAPGGPQAGMLQVAVSSGESGMIWGGAGLCGENGACADGAMYDAKSEQWQAMTNLGAPSPRYLHAGVWTGDKLIVWGGVGCGSSFGGPCGDGALYDPSADAWSPLESIDAPSARGFHSAVWTGSEMLVWGGEDPISHVLFSDGGRYDPETKQWHSMSQQGAPSPRRYHTAVWTGSRLLVWGGDASATKDKALGDGAVYDPGTDSWTPMSAAGSPSPRWAHTVVWTGSRMLVWGGLGCGGAASGEPGLCGDGGSYDPERDTWTPIQIEGAPSPRTGHSAVWTGTYMIVWGGGAARCENGRSGACLDGALYDPAADRWVSMTNAPSARTNHAAVWLGTSMLVWGGFGAGASELAMLDGAIYSP